MFIPIRQVARPSVGSCIVFIICVMISDVNIHYLTLAARCPVSGCCPSCFAQRTVNVSQPLPSSICVTGIASFVVLTLILPVCFAFDVIFAVSLHIFQSRYYVVPTVCKSFFSCSLFHRCIFVPLFISCVSANKMMRMLACIATFSYVHIRQNLVVLLKILYFFCICYVQLY